MTPYDISCANCRFWKSNSTGDERGECRRHAPHPANQALLFAGEAIIAISDILTRHWEMEWPSGIAAEATEAKDSVMFPRTWDDDWCGEHEPRP